jgi:hypothetical protein
MMLQISSADLQQYKQRYMLQQQQKRLLQAQQQQQLVIPSSATTVVEQLTPGLQNIDSLLNNTVAPNVSLQVSVFAENVIMNYLFHFEFSLTLTACLENFFKCDLEFLFCSCTVKLNVIVLLIYGAPELHF